MKGSIVVEGKGIDYETTFPDSTKFKCTRCGYCCSSQAIEFSKDEVEKIKKATGKKDEELGERDEIFSKDSLLKPANKRCVFLNEKKLCDVYGSRPLSCRSFPFIINFIAEDKAVIDVSHECVSIARQDANVLDYDFDEFVRQSSLDRKGPKFYESNYKAAEDEVKQHLDAGMANKRILEFVQSIIINNPPIATEAMAALIKSRKEEKLAYKDAGNLIGRIDEKSLVFNFQDFKSRNEKRLISDYHADKVETLCYCLVEGKQTGLKMTDGLLRIDNKIVKVTNKDFSNKAKQIMADYIRDSWKKKQNTISFNIAFSMTAKKMSGNLMLAATKDSLERLIFFALAIADKHGHEEVEDIDVKETLLFTDSLFIKSIMEAKI
jgi:Fe-S-cluster containining protein